MKSFIRSALGSGCAPLIISLFAYSAMAAGAQQPTSKGVDPTKVDQSVRRDTSAQAQKQISREEDSEAALRKAISSLSEQVRLLAEELTKMRAEAGQGGLIMQLLLYEERLSRTEQKIDELLEQKSLLDAREQELLWRTKNIQQEVTLRGGVFLRRDEAEAAIRAELQGSLEATRSQQSHYQERIAALQTEAEQIRERLKIIRSKTEPQEKDKDTESEDEAKPPDPSL